MKRYLFVAVVLAVVVAGCGVAEGEGDTDPGSGTESPKESGPKGNFELSSGRSLHMECRGAGSPAIVIEAGMDQPGDTMSDLRNLLDDEHLTCIYDRANIGESGDAPTPRTGGEIADDLHELLAEAGVPRPYALVGFSAGGFLVQSYARRYPDEVVGVVALNPVPPSDPWLERVMPLLDEGDGEGERGGEQAFYRGKNDERIDWISSTEEWKTEPPPSVPFEIIFSDETECEGDEFCLKTHDLYEEVAREVAQEWPEGRHEEVALGHDIDLEKPGLVIEAVERVSSKSDEEKGRQ